jgi:hypothetical protein
MKSHHVLLAVALALVSTAATVFANKVEFAKDGTCRVDGKPFFPIGIWVYGLNAEVMADLHEHRFNTIVGNSINPSDLPLIEKHGMMCVPMGNDAWVAAGAKSPALLAWYLVDEPEGANVKPEDVQKMYDALKKKDKDHPIGVNHCQLDGPPRYKTACDFTMTDVYPVDRDRKWPLNAVGMYTENPRKSHTPAWTNFTFIQTFGGPDSDGGIWAQPLPHEVRFMAMNALVYRAQGIWYFSYWPRAATTWASVAQLNRDIERIVPWLLAPGEEKPIHSSDPAIECRAKKVDGDGNRWIVITTNNSPKSIRTTTLKVDGMNDAKLTMPFVAGREVTAKSGEWPEHYSAYEDKVYVVGDEPKQ